MGTWSPADARSAQGRSTSASPGRAWVSAAGAVGGGPVEGVRSTPAASVASAEPGRARRRSAAGHLLLEARHVEVVAPQRDFVVAHLEHAGDRDLDPPAAD